MRMNKANTHCTFMGTFILGLLSKELPARSNMVRYLYMLTFFLLGKANIKAHRIQRDYEGDINDKGKPCGVGEAIDESGFRWFGTWLDGKKHGSSK